MGEDIRKMINKVKNFKQLVNENIEAEKELSKHEKYQLLKQNKPIIVYRGISDSGVNFYKGSEKLPFTYYSLTKEKAEKYGNLHKFIFNKKSLPIKIFKGSKLFDKFGEDTDYLHQAIYLAYEIFITNVLLKMKIKYQGKYKVSLEYRNIGKDAYRDSYKYAVDMSGPIWLDGATFMIDLQMENPKKTYEHINSYRIAHSIHNRSGIWTGPMLPPVKRIIDSIR